MRFALPVFALLVSTGAGQAPSEREQVLYFNHAQSHNQYQEILIALRIVAAVPQLSVDESERKLTLRAPANQLAMAEWIFRELDRPADPQPARHEYRVAGSGDDIVRVFYLSLPQTPRDLQDMATVVRSIADIQRLSVYTAQRAVTMRGTAGEMAIAEWLMSELDNPANRPPASGTSHEYRPVAGRDDIVRVFYLPRAQELQEVAARVRSTANIPRLFIHRGAYALVVRATAEQMALAERLIGEKSAYLPARALCASS